MAELTVGLAPFKNSYYDKITNTYITLDNPVQKVFYDENNMEETVVRLEKIVHALFASTPALKLYEGKVPEECIEHWKKKYMTAFHTDITKLSRNLNGDIVAPVANRAFDRPEKVNDGSAEAKVEVKVASTQTAKKAETKKTTVAKEEVKEEVKEEPKEEVKKPATRRRTTTRKKADE